MADASIYTLHRCLRCTYISQLVNLARVEMKITNSPCTEKTQSLSKTIII